MMPVSCLAPPRLAAVLSWFDRELGGIPNVEIDWDDLASRLSSIDGVLGGVLCPEMLI